VQAIDELAEHWHDRLGAPGWNWARHGYPPGWNGTIADRLRAGVFYVSRPSLCIRHR
jgi:hypothetical protein